MARKTQHGSQISSFVVVVQLLSRVQLFGTPWTAACQASLSFTITQSQLRLMSIELKMPSNHLILCLPLLLLSSIFPSIRVFSNALALHIKGPSFSFSISPSNEYSGLISFRIDYFELLAVQRTLKSLLQTTIPKHQLFSTQFSLRSNFHIHTRMLSIGRVVKEVTEVTGPDVTVFYAIR